MFVFNEISVIFFQQISLNIIKLSVEIQYYYHVSLVCEEEITFTYNTLYCSNETIAIEGSATARARVLPSIFSLYVVVMEFKLSFIN